MMLKSVQMSLFLILAGLQTVDFRRPQGPTKAESYDFRQNIQIRILNKSVAKHQIRQSPAHKSFPK